MDPLALVETALTLVGRVKETVDNVREAPEMAKNLKGRCLALGPHLKALAGREDLQDLFQRVEWVLQDVFEFLTNFCKYGWMLRITTHGNIHSKFEGLNVAIDRVVADMAFAVNAGMMNAAGGKSLLQKAPSQTTSLRDIRSKDTLNAVVDSFVDRYNDPKFTQSLELLRHKFAESPFHNVGWGAWADSTCVTYQQHKDDADAVAIHAARRFCLQLVYEMVDVWRDNDFSEAFCNAIATRFKPRRLSRILQPCLPLDRAHALFVLTHPGSRQPGKEWFCKLHLDNDYAYLMGLPGFFASPKEKQWWHDLANRRTQEYAKYEDEFKPPMNKRLFRVLFCDKFQLHALRHWAKPSLVPSSPHQQQHLPQQSVPNAVASSSSLSSSKLQQQVEDLKRQLKAKTQECNNVKKALQNKTRECSNLHRELAKYRNTHNGSNHMPQLPPPQQQPMVAHAKPQTAVQGSGPPQTLRPMPPQNKPPIQQGGGRGGPQQQSPLLRGHPPPLVAAKDQHEARNMMMMTKQKTPMTQPDGMMQGNGGRKTASSPPPPTKPNAAAAPNKPPRSPTRNHHRAQ